MSTTFVPDCSLKFLHYFYFSLICNLVSSYLFLTGLQDTKLRRNNTFYYRWIDYLLQKINLNAKAFLANASRERGEVQANMERIERRLVSIEENQEKTMQDLRNCFEEKVNETAQKLQAHLSSQEVITRFSSWTEDMAPEVEASWQETEAGMRRALRSRLKEVVESWEEKNNVLGGARKCLIESFKKHYLDVTSQLRDVERAIIEGDGNLASTNNDILSSSWTTEIVTRGAGVLSLFGVGYVGLTIGSVCIWGLPLVPTLLFWKELSGYWRSWTYQKDKASFMKSPSEKYLQGAADPENLKFFVRGELKEVENYLNNMKDSLPKLIKADKELCKRLASDERSQAENEKLYKPIFDNSLQQRRQLAIFGITEVCSSSISRNDVKWNEDASSMLGRGSFATVHKANLRRHGEDQIVALKVFHKELCKENAIAIMDEIYLLR